MGKRNKFSFDLETGSLFDGGIAKSDLAMFTGSPSKSSLNITAKVLQSAREAGYTIIYNSETAAAVSEKGKCILCDMIETLKKNDISVEDYGIKTVENIDGIVFPVTKHKNGMVIIDYPENPNKI